MYNATNDVSVPQMVRELADKHVQGRGHYSVKPLSEVNQTLREQMGITLGSQMDMTTPQQLGATLGVDGVLYGYLLSFDDMTTGVYNEKKVRAGFKWVMLWIFRARIGWKSWKRDGWVISVAGCQQAACHSVLRQPVQT